VPQSPVVALGTFDGVHRGHQAVLRQVIAWARRINGRAVVITFDRHPRRVIAARSPAPGPDARPGAGHLAITSLRHRLLLFERIGLDLCVVLRFDEHMADVEPEAFAREVLADWLHARGVLLGNDQRFGKDRRGDYGLLIRMGEDLGFEVRQAAPVTVDRGLISSTAIRKAILRGDLRAAERMLGRHVSVLGRVVRGAGRGRRLGFPTANLDLHHEIRPPAGVYRTIAVTPVGEFPSVTNIGTRPTFAKTGVGEESPEVIVETHLVGFSGDLYAQDLEVRFLEKLRNETKFATPELAARQISRDVRLARERFDAEPRAVYNDFCANKP